jgi:hypothetical protein
MNLTLSVDEATVERARRFAQASGTSLNQLVREYIEGLAGHVNQEEAILQLRSLLTLRAGNSGGRKISREEAYER